MVKTHVHTSIEHFLIEKAKERRINVSKLLEDSLINEINRGTLIPIPEDRFTEEEYERIKAGFSDDHKITWHYWINPRGELARRGKPMFFVNLHGKVREVDYLTWKVMKSRLGKEVKEVKKKKAKLGDTYPHLDDPNAEYS